MKKKKLWVVDLILLVGSLAVVLILFNSFSEQILLSPSETVTTEKDFLLEDIGPGVVSIDDNPDFSSPREFTVQDDLIITLSPGKHYVRISGSRGTEIREITVLSKIDLRLRDLGDGRYGVVNAGNVGLDVEVYSGGEEVDSFLLPEGEGVETGKGIDKILGRQDE